MTSPVKIWRNQRIFAGLLGKSGHIVTWTVIRVPQEGFSDQAPYPVAVVELEGGQRISAQVVDCEPEDLAVGQKVRAVVRRMAEEPGDGVIPYGIKVRPVRMPR